MTDGWRLLGEGNPQEALEYFNEILSEDPGHFANHWGRGKCLLMLRQNEQAAQSFNEAIKLATNAWSREEIAFDQIETIEKDLDKAAGNADSRIIERIISYIHGCLNIAGAYSYSKVLDDVERMVGLDARKISELVLKSLRSDNRFKYDQDQLQLAIVITPNNVIERRKELDIKVVFDLDKIARYRFTDVVDEWKEGITGIVNEASRNKFTAEDVILVLLNAATLKDAMQELEQRAGGDFGERANQWERFIFNLWVALPRWELAGLCLNESRIEDLWLGDMSKAWIGSVLGLMVDGDGDFCCPECREKVLLYDRHTHGVFDR
ncbi:MAG: tetratricopeptide repeat protein [Acidobacteriota bacterium]